MYKSECMKSGQEHSIASLLARRNAALKGLSGDTDLAHRRSELTHMIRRDYPAFEPVRDVLLKRHAGQGDARRFSDNEMQFIDRMDDHGLVSTDDDGRHTASHSEAKRYLGGGWLEEMAWLAAMEAGADEAVFAQTLKWSAKEYHGQNEIDLIVRKGGRLGFTSCKAVNSDFDSDSRKQRNRLMDALHEADNLVDHFGRDGDRVAILVTADLIDELRNQPRYIALMGKAAVLDVRVIPLEELGWEKLVSALGELIHDEVNIPELERKEPYERDTN